MKKSERCKRVNKANEEAKTGENQDNKDKPMPKDVILEVQDGNLGHK